MGFHLLRLGAEPLAPGDLFAFRRAGPLTVTAQVVTVVALYVATILLTHREYVARGTVFGYPGPAFVVLFAPITEELVFRGWVLGQMAARLSRPAALIGSSLLFGLYHLRNVYWLEADALLRQMAFTGLVLGPILAYLTLRFRTLWPAVILHGANNLAYYL